MTKARSATAMAAITAVATNKPYGTVSGEATVAWISFSTRGSWLSCVLATLAPVCTTAASLLRAEASDPELSACRTEVEICDAPEEDGAWTSNVTDVTVWSRRAYSASCRAPVPAETDVTRTAALSTPAKLAICLRKASWTSGRLRWSGESPTRRATKTTRVVTVVTVCPGEGSAGQLDGATEDGEGVCDGVGVLVDVGVLVGVGVLVDVGVDVGVGVLVGEGVAVRVGVVPGVRVGVTEGVGVADAHTTSPVKANVTEVVPSFTVHPSLTLTRNTYVPCESGTNVALDTDAKPPPCNASAERVLVASREPACITLVGGAERTDHSYTRARASALVASPVVAVAATCHEPGRVLPCWKTSCCGD
jgi:hypothetical protein